MEKILNITTDKLEDWNKFKEKPPGEALSSIYTYIENMSNQIRKWYWLSIKVKSRTSLCARSLSFFSLFLGTILPIISALDNKNISEHKLILMQLAIILLVVAGLIQLADRVFGWSSGWMRYISVVTQMENLTRNFQLEWAQYLILKDSKLDSVDVKALFELAKGLEQELTKLQAEETIKWITEFNTSTALLDTMIKMQRDETDKKLEVIQQAKLTNEEILKANKKADMPGALEVTFAFRAEVKTVKVGVDSEVPQNFSGKSWARKEIAPGTHILCVTTTFEPIQTIQRIVDIKPDTVATLSIQCD